MPSELRVNSPALDSAAIAKHLQLRGEIDGEGWRFPAAPSASAKSVGQQLDYWCAMLAKKKAGRRVLLRAGYTFTVRIVASEGMPIALTSEKIDALARLGLGLEVVCGPHDR